MPPPHAPLQATGTECGDPDTRTKLAACHCLLGCWAAAVEQLPVAVDLAPGDSLGYALLAEAQCGREHQPSPHHKPRRGSV